MRRAAYTHGPSLASRRDLRPGTAMIVAIIGLLLISAISFSLVRLAMAANQQTQRNGWRLQSEWLAESALSQVTAIVRRDPSIVDKDWTDGRTIENIHPNGEAGHVTVAVTQGDAVTITVTADFPNDPHDRVRTTRTWTFTPPTPPTKND